MRIRKRLLFAATTLTALFAFSCQLQAESCQNYVVNNATEAAQIVEEHWEDTYFQEIIVKEDSAKVKVDGEEEKFTEAFSATPAEMKEAVSSEKKLKEFFEDKKEEEGAVYQVEEEKSGSYSVTAPYQMKRIVIESLDVEQDFGAIEKYSYPEGKETILIFETEEDTEKAFEKIQKKYGPKKSYLDQIIHSEDVMQGLDTSYSWGASVMGMNTLKLSSAAKSKGKVTVAVLDSGIEESNALFNGTTILPAKYNFINNNRDVTDRDGHGTHVAGIIANLTPDNVQLLVLKILNDVGEGSYLSFNLAINYAVSQNVDVINISAGFTNDEAKDYIFLDNAINNAYKKGIPVCVAAGNTVPYMRGNDIGNCYPACNSQTVAVSALNQNKKIAEYSYYGNQIDFCAPGTEVRSASLIPNRVVSMSGTSMAAPHISAALAYIKMMNRNLSVEGTCLELRRYCEDLGSAGWDSYYGYGCPNIANLFANSQAYGSWINSQNLAAPVLRSANVNNGVRLSWNRVANATGYYIFCNSYGRKERKIATLGAGVTSFLDTSATEGNYNVYYVVAFQRKNNIISQGPRSNYGMMAVLRPIQLKKVKALKKKKIQLTGKIGLYYRGEKIQIQYAKNKAFRKPSTKTYQAGYLNYKVKMPKKGVYYVRMRRTLKFNGLMHYSAWSNVKKIKVK